MKQYGKRNAMDVVIWLKNYDNLFTATCSLCQSQLCGFPHRSYLGATAERTLSSFRHRSCLPSFMLPWRAAAASVT